MERDDVPEKIIRLKKAFYERTSVQVCKYGEMTDSFETRLCPFPYNMQLCDRSDNEPLVGAQEVSKSVQSTVSQILNTLMM
ncbi:unnamed protein product [Dracunculus medinensis]|uniref:Uncharacterized protein n=1 Tax=Dracunculus medinensis TaxID=318479 RepID=A0A0N4UQM3_DRAME|nr:unnamed protein product [Dracunculus medinensis]